MSGLRVTTYGRIPGPLRIGRVVAFEHNWCRVRWEDGSVSWLHVEVLEFDQPCPPEPMPK